MDDGMNLHDALMEIWRWAEEGTTEKETTLETSALNFQEQLNWENNFIGHDTRENFIGPLESRQMPDSRGNFGKTQMEEWNPFSEDEIDAIRHYYAQKIALENENPMVALGAPLAHEVTGEYGVFSPWWEESLYDLAVNAIGAKDYYMDEGLPGTPFGQMLTDGNVTAEEFKFWGNDALNRIPVYNKRRDDDKY